MNIIEREIKSVSQLKKGNEYFIHSGEGFRAKYIGLKNKKYWFKPIDTKRKQFNYSEDEIYDFIDYGYIEEHFIKNKSTSREGIKMIKLMDIIDEGIFDSKEKKPKKMERQRI